jgi:hypothetical protein
MHDLTAKEKAKELVNWYYDNLPQWVNMYDAKMCANKLIDELLKVHPNTLLDEQKDYNFWLDVKKEIKKGSNYGYT